MVRTQIQLPEDQHRRLKRWARERGISLSEAIRRFVSERLAAEEQAPTKAMLLRDALSVIGKYEDPEQRSDVATEHDAYLARAYRNEP